MPNPIAPTSSRTYRPRLAVAAPEFGIPYLVEAEILAQRHHGRHSHREYQLLFVVEGATHIDLYDRPQFVMPAVAKLKEFFGRHLAASRGVIRPA